MTGYWRFDEGNGDTTSDVASEGPLVFFTNATWTSGRVGLRALHFNGGTTEIGSRAWAVNSNYSLLPESGPFSVSLWFRPDALATGWRGLIGNGSNGWSVALHTPSAGTNYIVFVSERLNVSAQALLLPGQWYDLTIAFDGTAGSIYLDGNLLARETGQVASDEGPIYIGGGIAGYYSFLGRIDEVRTYRSALGSEQISLAGHWSFDEVAGTVIHDGSIYGHHGRAGAIDSVPAKSGNAVRLGSNDVVIPNDDYLVLPPSGKAFSLSFWILPNSLSASRSALMSASDDVTANWQLTLETDPAGFSDLCLKSLGMNGTLDLRAPLVLSTSAWTRLDITYNGAIATIYANARKLQHDSGAIHASRLPLRIGSAPATRNFDGLIDDLKIYRRERGASEIGPIATTMWETVFRGGRTNIVLQGSGPVGKTLHYTILDNPSTTKGTITHVAGSSNLSYQAGTVKGPETIFFTVSDGEFTSAPAALTLSIVEPHWLSTVGGALEPRDGSSPERAWLAGSAAELDAIWRTNNYYDCFFYAPGVYETRGWRFETRPTAHPGCKHIGCGWESAQATTIRLIGATESLNEECIFAPRYATDLCDGFELHNMVLDCNAQNNPKYTRGEPVWIRIPLATTAQVENIALHWNLQSTPSLAGGAPWQMGPAKEFRVCTRSDYLTNCSSHISTGTVDRVAIGVQTDEITLHLDRRDHSINFYSIRDIEVSGASISLPKASLPGGGESTFIPGDAAHSVLRALDDNFGTSWTSGTETNMEIFVPLNPGTSLTHLTLHWNCQTVAGVAVFGPALDFSVQMRDQATGLYVDAPFTRDLRTPQGGERLTFQPPVQTDALLIVLTAREPGIDHYSLREITLANGHLPIRARVPSALTTTYLSGPIMGAFDQAPESTWASHTQGAVTAAAVCGNNLKFTRLKVIGFGTTPGRECFPFHILNRASFPLVGNIVMEDCLFTEPAPDNADGLTTIVMAGDRGSLTNAIIRRCSIRGLKPHFRYSHGFGAAHVENSVVEDCGQAVYFEPIIGADDLGPILIKSNRFINVNDGIYMAFHPGSRFGGITCIGNEIVLAQRSGWGFAACDLCGVGPGGTITNVTLLNNVIRYADWLPRPANAEGGFYYSDIGNATVVNNVIQLGTRSSLRIRNCPEGWLPPPFVPQVCPPYNQPDPGNQTGSYPRCLDVLPPNYRRIWSNNHDLSGILLPVSFHNAGVFGPALQQQPLSELP